MISPRPLSIQALISLQPLVGLKMGRVEEVCSAIVPYIPSSDDLFPDHRASSTNGVWRRVAEPASGRRSTALGMPESGLRWWHWGGEGRAHPILGQKF